MLAPLVHFFPCHQRRFDRSKVHLLGINMGLDRADEFARQAGLSGGMSHFDERLLLPVVRGGGVIAQRLRQRNGQFPLRPLRAQSQIDSKHCALTRHPRQNLGHLLSKTNEIFTVGNRRPWRLYSVAEDVH